MNRRSWISLLVLVAGLAGAFRDLGAQPAPTIAGLKASVQALVPAKLSAANARLLTSLLDLAQSRLTQGRKSSALVLLNTFISSVNTLKNATPPALASADAAALTSQANAVISAAISPPVVISGTAARGLPIAGTTVTVRDRTGVIRTGTTDSSGSFSVDLSGLSDPYLLKVVAPPNTYYSEGFGAGTANVTPLSDLILRQYYQVQGLNIDSEFTAPTVAPPTQTEIQIIETVINPIVSGWLTQAGLNSSTFNLITTPFAANGSGFDGVLDLTTVSQTSSNVLQVVISNGTTTQTSTVTASTATSSISQTTTTVAPSGTSNSAGGSVVPTPAASALQTATDAVNALLGQFGNVIIARGNQLADSDLLPFASLTLVDDGNNRSVWAGLLASNVRGNSGGTLAIQQIVAFDNTTNPASPVLTATTNFGDRPTQFVKVGGSWFFNGNQQLGNIGIQVENRRDESFAIGAAASFKKDINGGVRAPQGTISSMTVQIDPAVQTTVASNAWALSVSNPWPVPFSVPKNFSSQIQPYQPTPTTSAILTSDQFFFNAGAWPGTPTIFNFPPPGTLISVQVTPTVGLPQTYLVSTNATTTSTFTLTNPTGYLLASANLGGSLIVTWAPPVGFLIGSQEAGAPVFAGSIQQQFDGGNLTPTATSATLNLPTTLNPGSGPQPVTSVTINVSINGPNGERMIILHTLDQ